MKKTGVLCCLLALGYASSTFAQSNSGLAIYPMDSFDPKSVADARNIKITDPNDFVYTYMSEVGPFLKKGEFEKTVDYQDRIKGGIKLKGLKQDKLYAFKIDYLSHSYNPDTEIYEFILSKNSSFTTLKENTSTDNDSTPSYTSQTFVTGNNKKDGIFYSLSEGEYLKGLSGIFISHLKPKHPKYNISIQGAFYLMSSGLSNRLEFPVDIKTAKETSQCKKNLYIIAKLGAYFPYRDTLTILRPFGQKTNIPSFRNIGIPMDIAGLVLKCSNGKVLGSY